MNPPIFIYNESTITNQQESIQSDYLLWIYLSLNYLTWIYPSWSHSAWFIPAWIYPSSNGSTIIRKLSIQNPFIYPPILDIHDKSINHKCIHHESIDHECTGRECIDHECTSYECIGHECIGHECVYHELPISQSAMLTQDAPTGSVPSF